MEEMVSNDGVEVAKWEAEAVFSNKDKDVAGIMVKRANLLREHGVEIPWDGESNRQEFKHAGLDCLMRRNSFGVWCGYVGLPPSHIYYQKGCEELNVPAFRSINYSNHCFGDICHAADEGAEKVWWLGFACDTSKDLMPMVMNGGDIEFFKRMTKFGCKYVTEAVVKQAVCDLADILSLHGSR